MKKLILSLLTLCLAFSYSFSQEINVNLSDTNNKSIQYDGVFRCYTTEIEAILDKKFPNRGSKEDFENWINEEIKKKNKAVLNKSSQSKVVRTIPVVFHILSDGVGVDNVSQSLIDAQIAQINLDFANQSGSTIPVSVDSEIQFCAARQSPIGQNLSEYGINRITKFGDGPFGVTELQNSIKPVTQWDPEQYLNIWVGPLSGTVSGGALLGYAQFPEAASLSGIGTGNGGASTDGVVIASYTVGSKANPNPESGIYATGITLTHEIGHWLGLRHIWGDGPCSVDDFCADTPESDAPNFGCSASGGSFSCGTPDMISNYMDYTSDACKNTFTADQSARMNIVLDGSIRRKSLVESSEVCELAPVYNLDAGLELINLNNPDCTTTITPELKLTNLGVTNLTQATIEYNIDSSGIQTINWTGNLLTNESTVITIPEQTLARGFHSITIEVTNPNSGVDEETQNNDVFKLFSIDFYDEETINFTLKPDNFGSQTTWEFRDETNTVIYSGGPYTDFDSTEITEVFAINSNGCYTFSIFDSNDNGICCDFGNGFYNLKTPSGTVIKNGAIFGSSEVTNILLENSVLSTQDFFINNAIKLYPNPVTNFVNISVGDTNNLPDSYIIYNVLGQKLVSTNISNSTDLIINTKRFSSGVHFIKIFKDDMAQVFRFIKR